MTEPITIGAIVVLVISNVGGWIREWRKGRKNENGTLLKCIDGKVGKIKTDVAVIKTNQEAQEKHCREVTGRFEGDIANNRDKIFDIMKRNKD